MSRRHCVGPSFKCGHDEYGCDTDADCEDGHECTGSGTDRKCVDIDECTDPRCCRGPGIHSVVSCSAAGTLQTPWPTAATTPPARTATAASAVPASGATR